MTKHSGILSPFLVVLVALIQSYGCENEDIRPDAETAANSDAQADTESRFTNFKDPGKGEWELGTLEYCKTDPTKFNRSNIPDFVLGYAVFRYGKLCYKEGDDVARQMMSATMTLGGIMVGRASHLARDVPRTGPGTGPIMHMDLGTDWIATPTYGNQDASINHIMAMVAAASPSIAENDLRFEYDTYGDLAINDLITATEKCIGQIPSLPKDAKSFVQQEIFDKMGMTSSSWTPEIESDELTKILVEAGLGIEEDFTETFGDFNFYVGIGAGWKANLSDMGKFGILLLHEGWYGNERLVSQEWIYRMSHPSFESANTAYGLLTWVNHRGNAVSVIQGLDYPDYIVQGDLCAPAAFWPVYPHPPSQAQDCMATFAGASCSQSYDAGVFYSYGATEYGGAGIIVVHPGLDMVLVAQMKHQPGSYEFGPNDLWDAIRPGVLAMDPNYNGDEEAFCRDYGAGNYAPDLVLPRFEPQ